MQARSLEETFWFAEDITQTFLHPQRDFFIVLPLMPCLNALLF